MTPEQIAGIWMASWVIGFLFGFGLKTVQRFLEKI